jgi:hypothetical protein
MSVRKSYNGSFRPKNTNKYHGTLPIIYRSSWEFAFMRWCDENPRVINWASESVVIPYYFQLDKKNHRYYVDFMVTFEKEGVYLIEIKPKRRIAKPKPNKTGRVTVRFIREQIEHDRNIAKWEAAQKYAKERGLKFCVWTEDDLRSLGIPII